MPQATDDIARLPIGLNQTDHSIVRFFIAFATADRYPHERKMLYTASMASQYHHGDLRRALVEHALLAIESGGLDAVRIRSLSREIGVTHRAAAAHFRDKSDLLAAALAVGYGRLSARLSRGLVQGATPESFGADQPDAGALLRIALAYGAFVREEPKLFLAMSGARLNASGRHAELEEAIQSAFAHVVDAARMDGYADAENAALHFWACMLGVLLQCALGRIRVRPAKWDSFVALTAQRVVHGLAAGGSPRAG